MLEDETIGQRGRTVTESGQNVKTTLTPKTFRRVYLTKETRCSCGYY